MATKTRRMTKEFQNAEGERVRPAEATQIVVGVEGEDEKIVIRPKQEYSSEVLNGLIFVGVADMIGKATLKDTDSKKILEEVDKIREHLKTGKWATSRMWSKPSMLEEAVFLHLTEDKGDEDITIEEVIAKMKESAEMRKEARKNPKIQAHYHKIRARRAAASVQEAKAEAREYEKKAKESKEDFAMSA